MAKGRLDVRPEEQVGADLPAFLQPSPSRRRNHSIGNSLAPAKGFRYSRDRTRPSGTWPFPKNSHVLNREGKHTGVNEIMGSLRDIRRASRMVVRSVYFQSFEGRVRWKDKSGKEQEVTFDDPLDRRLADYRLWCAVEPGFHFMDVALEAAETKRAELEELQRACVRGLIVTTDEKRGGAIKASVDASRWRVTSHDALPISIPEQVLVWASNEVRAHIFEYFVGGVARTLNPAAYDHSVWVFFPKDPELAQLVIKWGREHQ